MEMTDAEIYRSWKQAENKKRQIRILSELNVCSGKQIREIVDRMEQEAGERMKEATKKRRGRPKATPEAPAAPPLPERPPEEVLETVKRRIAELIDNGESIKRCISELQDDMASVTEEWARLTEWLSRFPQEEKPSGKQPA